MSEATLVELAVKPDGSLVARDAFGCSDAMFIWRETLLTIVDCVAENIIGQLDVATLFRSGKKSKKGDGKIIVAASYCEINRSFVGITADGVVFALKADDAAALASPELVGETLVAVEGEIHSLLLVPAAADLSVVVVTRCGQRVLVHSLLGAAPGKSTTATKASPPKGMEVLQASMTRRGGDSDSGAESLLHLLVLEGGRHCLYIEQLSPSPAAAGTATALDFDSDSLYPVVAHTASTGFEEPASSSAPKAKRSKTQPSTPAVGTSMVAHGSLNCVSVFVQHAGGTLTHSKHHMQDAQLLYTRAVQLPAPAAAAAAAGVRASVCSVSAQQVGVACGPMLLLYDVHYGLVAEVAALGVVAAGATTTVRVLGGEQGRSQSLCCAVEQVAQGGRYSCAKLALQLSGPTGVPARASLSAMLGKLSAIPSTTTTAKDGSVLGGVSAGSRTGLQAGLAKYRASRAPTEVDGAAVRSHYLDVPCEAATEFLQALQAHARRHAEQGAGLVPVAADDWEVVELLLLGACSLEHRTGASSFSLVRYPEVLELLLAHGRVDLLLLLLRYCPDLSEVAAVRLVAHFMTCDLVAVQQLRFKWRDGRRYSLELAGDEAPTDGKRKRKAAAVPADAGAVEVTNRVVVSCLLHALLTRAPALSFNAHLLGEALRQHMPTTGVVVLLQLLAGLLKVRVGGRRSVKVTGECSEITAARMISWVEACIDAKFTTFVASCSLAHKQLTAALQTLLSCVIGLEDNTTGCEQALGLWIHLCRMRQSKESRGMAAGADAGEQIAVGGACSSLYQVESVFL